MRHVHRRTSVVLSASDTEYYADDLRDDCAGAGFVRVCVEVHKCGLELTSRAQHFVFGVVDVVVVVADVIFLPSPHSYESGHVPIHRNQDNHEHVYVVGMSACVCVFVRIKRCIASHKFGSKIVCVIVRMYVGIHNTIVPVFAAHVGWHEYPRWIRRTIDCRLPCCGQGNESIDI